MEKSDSIKELALALNNAQGEMKAALKDSANPFFKSKYADFTSVWETCRVPLAKHGLAVSQIPIAEGGQVGVETILMHISGEWISGKLTLPLVKQDPQSAGSAITYARRYALSGIVCLATEEDDDGNKGSQAGKKPEPQKMANKAPESPPQPTSAPEGVSLSAKEKLKKEMWDYLRNIHSDTDENFRILLMTLTEFAGDDGTMKYAESIDKMSDKWCFRTIGKLKEYIKESEMKDYNASGKEDDAIPY